MEKKKSHIKNCVLCHEETDGTKSICLQCFKNSRNETNICPSCKGSNIERQNAQVFSCNTIVTINFYCEDCGCSYTQYYTLFFDYNNIN